MTKVPRRLPRPAELRSLLRPRPVQLDGTERRLGRAASIPDLRTIARRRTPRAVFDYADGAADNELSLRRAREAFSKIEFQPSVLNDVSNTDTGCDILGRHSTLPFALAPIGFTRMMHHEGERAVASVAQQVGIPYALSTLGTTTIEAVAEAAPEARKWFQLYIWRDRAPVADLVARAAAAGYDTLILTVDVPVAGARLRDVRNGLTVPPTISLRTFLDGASHPHWWFNLLTTEPLTFAGFTSTEGHGRAMNHPGFRALLPSWEGCRDAEQVRQGDQGQGGSPGQGSRGGLRVGVGGHQGRLRSVGDERGDAAQVGPSVRCGRW